MKRQLATAAAATVAAGAACFGWGLIEASQFTVRRVDLDILPPGGKSLRILHVSDVHLTTKQHFKLDFVRSLAAVEPDLVINTGDNIAEADAVFPLMAAWNKLRFVPGVFVFGSNDYYAPTFRNPVAYLLHGKSKGGGKRVPDLPFEDLRSRMTKYGWRDVMHRRETIEVNGYRIAFRGTDDAHLGRDRYDTVAGPADPKADLNIGVTTPRTCVCWTPWQPMGWTSSSPATPTAARSACRGTGPSSPTATSTPSASRACRRTRRAATSHLHVSAGIGVALRAVPVRLPPGATLLTPPPPDQLGGIRRAPRFHARAAVG